MRELSLNILDIVENSVRAGATLIKVSVIAKDGFLTIEIADDGKGMSEEFLRSVTDPFTTTRTTRKVGMGIPLFKMAAETANGSFDIKSKLGDAPCFKQRKPAVRRAFVVLDVEFTLDRGKKIAAALYVTCRAETYRNLILPLRIQRKLRIECRDAENFFKRNVQCVGNLFLNFDGKVSVNFLRCLHRGHKRTGNAFQFVEFFGKFRVLFGRTGKRNFREFDFCHFVLLLICFDKFSFPLSKTRIIVKNLTNCYYNISACF